MVPNTRRVPRSRAPAKYGSRTRLPPNILHPLCQIPMRYVYIRRSGGVPALARQGRHILLRPLKLPQVGTSKFARPASRWAEISSVIRALIRNMSARRRDCKLPLRPRSTKAEDPWYRESGCRSNRWRIRTDVAQLDTRKFNGLSIRRPTFIPAN